MPSVKEPSVNSGTDWFVSFEFPFFLHVRMDPNIVTEVFICYNFIFALNVVSSPMLCRRKEVEQSGRKCQLKAEIWLVLLSHVEVYLRKHENFIFLRCNHRLIFKKYFYLLLLLQEKLILKILSYKIFVKWLVFVSIICFSCTSRQHLFFSYILCLDSYTDFFPQ